MLALRLRGSTALIALSLALALPAPVSAQDTAAATQPAPPTWGEVQRFGLRLGVIDGAEVTQDSDSDELRQFSASTTGAGDIGVRTGLRLLMGAEVQELPLADPEALAAFLSEITGIPVAPTGGVMDLGGRLMDIYGGTGTREAEGGPIDTRILFLVARDLDDEGHGLMISVYSGGQGAEAAALIEADFVTRLGLADPSPAAEPVADEPVADEPAVAADAEPQAADTAPAEPPTAESPTAESPSAEAPPAQDLADVGPELLDGAVRVALPDGLELGSLVHSSGVSDLQLVGPGIDSVRIMAGLLPLPLAMQVDRMLHRIDGIDSAEIGGQPVWLVDGPTRIAADDTPTEAQTAPPARLVVPQFCSGALPSYVVAMTAPTGDVLDTLTASLSLTRPDDAEDCPGAADALRITPPPEPVAAPDPVAATEPAGESVQLLGGLVTLTLAEGTSINAGARGRELSDVTLTAADGHLVRIVGGELPQSLSAQVARLLHRVDAIDEVTLGAETLWVIHGNATRTPANAETPADSAVPARVLVPQFCTEDEASYVLALGADEGNAAALDPVIQSLTISRPSGAVDCSGGIETITVTAPAAPASTPDQPAASAPLPEGWETRERFGLRFALPEGGLVRLDTIEDGLMAYWVQYRNSESDSLAEFSLRIMGPEALAQITQGAAPVDYPALLSQFSNRPIVATGETRDQGDETLSIYRNEPGEGSARILYLIGEAPSAEGLTTWAVIASSGLTEDQALDFETNVLANLQGSAVHVSAPAPEPEAPVAAEPQPQPPAPVQPAPPTRDSAAPSTGTRQPTDPQGATPGPATVPAPAPAPTQSPEALAWAEAQRQGTPAAMLAYLAEWPRGLHSGEARAWLAARAIIAPAVPTAPVAPAATQLSADDRDWQAALARGTAEAFWDYLKAQQQGAHVAEAYAQLTLLASRAPAPLAPPPASPRK